MCVWGGWGAAQRGTDTDPTSGLVVVEIHHEAGELRRVSRIVAFALARVDEDHRELVAVVGVVAAAAPQPVGGQVGRAGSGAAAARTQLALPARPRHRVQHPGRHERLAVRRLRATCTHTHTHTHTPTSR